MTNPILPGGIVTSKLVNDIIATQNVEMGEVQKLQTVSEAGQKPPLYQSQRSSFVARIIGNPFEDGRYEWEEQGRFTPSAGTHDRFDLDPLGRASVGLVEGSEQHLIHPAIEVNGRKDVPIGSLVILHPLKTTDDELGFETQEFFFSASTNGLRSFEVAEVIITRKDPAGEADPENANPDLVRGFFLDDPTKTLHWFVQADNVPRNVVGEEPLSHGVARPSGNYNTGTRGWAVWTNRVVVNQSTNESVGAWEIVELDASRIYDYVVDTNPIPNNATGIVNLWWNDVNKGRDNPELIDSQFNVVLSNISGRELQEEERGQMYWDQTEYTWKVLNPNQTEDIYEVHMDADQVVGAGGATLLFDTELAIHNPDDPNWAVAAGTITYTGTGGYYMMTLHTHFTWSTDPTGSTSSANQMTQAWVELGGNEVSGSLAQNQLTFISTSGNNPTPVFANENTANSMTIVKLAKDDTLVVKADPFVDNLGGAGAKYFGGAADAKEGCWLSFHKIRVLE